jgi:outer membrane lipase/esterase
MMAAQRALLVALGFLLSKEQASAVSFDQFVSFGDSTLDSGWWAGALAGQCGPVSSPCTTGNATKDSKIAAAIAAGGTGAPVGVGQMNTQILAADFGLTALPANQPAGTNYAISGATDAAVSQNGNIGNLNPNPNLPSTSAQIGLYLSSRGGSADPHALYVLSSGGNDITYANDNFTTLAAKESYLSLQAANLAAAIATLQSAGAKAILVYNNYGQGTLANFYNQRLSSDLNTDAVKFTLADIQSLVATVEANPTAYGFTASTVLPGVAGAGLNTSSACVAGAGATGWGQFCADTIIPNPNYAHLRAIDSEQTSFFSDDQHFSAAGQLIEANYVYGLIQKDFATVPSPVVGAGLPGLVAACVAVLASWRRRRKKALSTVATASP